MNHSNMYLAVLSPIYRVSRQNVTTFKVENLFFSLKIFAKGQQILKDMVVTRSYQLKNHQKVPKKINFWIFEKNVSNSRPHFLAITAITPMKIEQSPPLTLKKTWMYSNHPQRNKLTFSGDFWHNFFFNCSNNFQKLKVVNATQSHGGECYRFQEVLYRIV